MFPTEKTTPTCVDDGTKTKVCIACGKQEKEIIPATGRHKANNPVETVITEATCGKTGEKKITVRCSECGNIISETMESIPATGKHTADNTKEITVRAATCTEAGEKKIVVACTVCGEILSENVELIADIGHIDLENDGICNICNLIIPESINSQNDNACKWCSKVHPNTFIGKLTAFLHGVLYFFAHLFGRK